MNRSRVQDVDGKSPEYYVNVEACGGSNYWAAVFQGFGHQVQLISPQYVKPFVKTNKSDFADATAIVIAGMNPNMRFVPIKSIDLLDLQMVHRIRERLVRQRTSLLNEVRAIFYEHGVIFAKGAAQTEKILRGVVNKTINFESISDFCLRELSALFDELKHLTKRVDAQTQKLEQVAKESDDCKRIMKVPGVGVITATAVIASAPNPSQFKNGRHFSAWLGLVPKHCGTGGKTNVLSISKRGDTYLRSLLVQGAQISLHRVKKPDKNIEWAKKIKERSCTNKAAIALANKNARIIWHLLCKKDDYRPMAA